MAAPFVAADPAGARVRTRLRVSEQDAEVLWAVGRHLGELAGRDLAARCAEGRLDAKEQADSRRERKRALTVESTSRWAGTITRASEDAWQLADRNLTGECVTLAARTRKITARLAVQAGTKNGRTAGYANPAERHAKTIRFKTLQARLARVERQLENGTVRVTRGGRRLMRARLNLAQAGLTEQQWRRHWEAARLFLQADGDAAAPHGNYCIVWHPGDGWLEVTLPASLAHLANRPRSRYRLSCPVQFTHRSDEVAAQATSGPVQYEISLDPIKDRWYLDAAWKTPARLIPSLEELRAAPVIAVDVNAGHLAVSVLVPDGNISGTPFTIPLQLDELPAATRDGRIRAAVTQLIATTRVHGAQAIVIENLDFKEAREQGRERTGNRPARGKRGRSFRRTVAGIPTARFRDRLVQMFANARLHVVVVDPAYSSRWGRSTGSRPCASTTPNSPGTTRLRWCSGDADSATGPGAARMGTPPPQRTRRGQPRRDPGNPQCQDRTKETRRPTRPPAATRR